MREELDRRGGILGLPLIRNVKNLDPADPSTPKVVQIETAMGAAIEVFEDARTIEVGRDRFIPVKTTNDLLVLRSDVYDLGRDFGLDQASDVPFVELDPDFYKLVGDFDQRFPQGAPSLRQAHLAQGRGRLHVRQGRAGRRRRGARVRAGEADRGRHGARRLMADLRSVAEHQDQILDSLRPLAPYDQPLLDALGLVSAEDVFAPIALPSFDNSAMDGYAVVQDDVATATDEAPCTCPSWGRSAPARPASSRCRPAPP